MPVTSSLPRNAGASEEQEKQQQATEAAARQPGQPRPDQPFAGAATVAR